MVPLARDHAGLLGDAEVRRSALLALLLLASGLAAGAEIREYATRVDVDASGGGRAASTLVITGDPGDGRDSAEPRRLDELPAGGGPRRPPAGAAAGEGDDAPGDAASRVETARAGSRSTFDVPQVFAKPEDPAAGGKRRCRGSSRTLRYAFVNSQLSADRDFRVLVDPSRGMPVHAIREQLPKLDEVRGGARASGSAANRGPAERPAEAREPAAGRRRRRWQLEAVPNSRSPLWLVAGVVLSVLYLFNFRDLVVEERGMTPPRRQPDHRSAHVGPACRRTSRRSAEEAAKIVPRAEFRVFGPDVIDLVKAKMWNGRTVLFQARKMPAETYFSRAHTNEANVKVRDGLLDIKTKIGETPEGYEIFQPRGKFQFPVKKAELATILSHLKVEMPLDAGDLHDRRVHRDGPETPGPRPRHRREDALRLHRSTASSASTPRSGSTARWWNRPASRARTTPA